MGIVLIPCSIKKHLKKEFVVNSVTSQTKSNSKICLTSYGRDYSTHNIEISLKNVNFKYVLFPCKINVTNKIIHLADSFV